MALERWELEQRRRGNIAGAEMAHVLRSHFGDVPLPSGEASVEVKRFSPEARQTLEKEGYLIYQLTGQSIKSLRKAGRKFWSTWHEDYPDLEALTSRQSEVAINPKQLFLPDSNRKTLAEQEAMVAEFSRELTQKVEGVEAIIGEVADYGELAFSHLDATSEYLFGEKHNFDYARTKTQAAGSYVALVGLFDPVDGLGVSSWRCGYGSDDVWAVPLVMPKS